MPSSREQTMLVLQTLVKAHDSEKRMLVARKTLVDNCFFEPYDIFKVLDKERKFFVSPEDIYEIVKQIYPEIKKTSVDYVFYTMTGGEPKMDFDMFSKYVTTEDYHKPYKNIYYLNKQSFEDTPVLNNDTLVDFANLVKVIHDETLLLDKCAQTLNENGVTGELMFIILSNQDKGFLDVQDLQDLLSPYIHYIGRRFFI